MKCSNCNFENSDNAKLCQKCGSKLESQLKACTNEKCRDHGISTLPLPVHFCMMCGYILLPDDKYCILCGVKRPDINNLGREEKIEDSFSEEDGYINDHGYVDLGLPSGLKWATCNVGAYSPEEYGDYYAWGETYTKDEYEEDNCDLCGVEMENIGGTEHDAATAIWGGSWRLPTRSELNELKRKCIWEWTKKGKKGYKVTGPNGNSIFLPAAGHRYGSSLDYAGGEYGNYWSSTPGESDSDYAYDLYFGSGGQEVGLSYRYRGRSVRPVSE